MYLDQITTSPVLLALLAAASFSAGIALIKVADGLLTSDTSRLARGIFWWPLAATDTSPR